MKSLHHEHHITMTGCTPSHIMTMTIGTDSSPLIADTVKEDSSTSQDHINDPTTAAALATMEEMHPIPIQQPQQFMLHIN